jgi:hypothetical protein
MELHEDSSFTPDQHPHLSQPTTNAFGPSRRLWRAPAIGTSMALVAALCLYTGSAAQASATPAVAKVSLSVQGAAAKSALSPNVTTGTGGVHGAFNVYDGPGGGVEFWFNPSTGQLTLAVASGAGVGASGVLGTYAPGTEPAPGTYLFASATLAAGTVASENVSGSYSLNNGVFSGSVTGTVEGRSVTLTSDGVSGFNVSVLAGSGAVGWSASTGIKFVFDFNITDVVNYVWDAIKNFFTGDYSLTDTDYDDEDTTVYSDASGTDGTVISSDGSTTSDSSSSSDSDSGDDAGDSGDDSGGGGGGGGTSDDDGAPIMEESHSIITVLVHASTPSTTSATSGSK